MLAIQNLLGPSLKVQAYRKWDLAGSININLGKAFIQLPVVLKAHGHQIQPNGIWAILMYYLVTIGSLQRALQEHIFGTQST